jgi:3alpha(or 20beta)-hydroxysteroid dehydrogenase
VTDVREELGGETAASIGGEAMFRRLDVTDLQDWERGIAAVVGRFGGLDILVNNAGGGAGGRIDLETPEQHRRILDLNVTGVWNGCKSVISAMTDRGGGSIVNISSIDGLAGVAHLSTYVATKFAVTGLTRSLALELGDRNIRVNSVHPGITDTPLVRGALARPEMGDRMRKAIERQPIKRIGRPEEVANAVLFFASDESSYCTGAQLLVDGGHLAGPYRDPISE